MAVTGDDGGDSRWMTYAELAEARGIKEPAAIRLVQRRRWKRQPGNDGAARVAVPLSELRPSRLVTPDVVLVGGDSRAREREALQRADQAEGELRGVRGALAEAVKRADQAETRERDARALADQRGVEMTAALVRAARAEGELAEARRPMWRRWFGLL